jgi:hypothetical protein
MRRISEEENENGSASKTPNAIGVFYPVAACRIWVSKLLRFGNDAAKLLAFGELESGSQTTCP